MNEQDLQQVRAIIENLHKSNKKVPYFTDLQQHNVYGQFFNDLDGEEIEKILNIIHDYIKESILNPKTKWGEMFQRFYVMNQDIFRRFRELNADESNTNTEEFQTLGKDIEEQLFKFEWILTQNMMKKPQGLDKVIGAFYDIVYSFFPLYNQIQ